MHLMFCLPHEAEKLQMFSEQLFKHKEFQHLSGRDHVQPALQ